MRRLALLYYSEFIPPIQPFSLTFVALPDASALFNQMVVTALLTLPPPACPTLYLIVDKTTQQKSGKKMPLAHKTRMNEFAPYVFGLDLVLLIAQWGRFCIPVACELIDPKIKGHQNIQFRQMLRRFRAPVWHQQVVVIADAGFASKENLRLIKGRYVFGLARTSKLEDGTHLKDLANHLPRKRYRRVAPYNPARRGRDYWVFVRRAKLKTLGDVTVLLSKFLQFQFFNTRLPEADDKGPGEGQR